MAFETDMALAENFRQVEVKNTNLTAAEVAARYQRRALFAHQNNGRVADAHIAALTAMQVPRATASIDEKSYGAALGAVIADIATLVADGATPTQAHVSTLNTDWVTLKKHVVDLRHYTASAHSAVDSNIATLVADGASPTQAHVTTLNTNWATHLAALI